MFVTNVSCYIPIPFLMSTAGWGILLNTTWRHWFDCGQSKSNRLRLGGSRGELDYYLIAGQTLPTLLDRYTDIAGKPVLLPQWGYGLTFVCHMWANIRDVLNDGHGFRREGIPCDVIGLEPGWMEEYYDVSTDKKWHPDRFWIPPWFNKQKSEGSFIDNLRRMGFKLSLWLCCDYDLTWYEEQLATGNARQNENALGFHPDDEVQDGHLVPMLMDKITDPREPWFEHLKKFVDQGALAFKMDGAFQVNAHPDRKWGNGMDDEQMHNLYPTVLNKQMSLGYRQHTGKRSMIYSSGGYAGIQQYAATWTGDTGGGIKPLVGMLNLGLTGHSNTTCDLNPYDPDAIHVGFLLPWSQICSWASWQQPWFLGSQTLQLIRDYARLRYRLLPYIYCAAHVATQTGLPVLRAMPLAFPDDPMSDQLTQQYMLGDFLLVGAFTRQIHLPAGRWIDFWTGQDYSGPMDLDVKVPADRSGPLFVKAGAILPQWPDTDYVNSKPVGEIHLHVWPDGQSDFTMYEDDGQTHAYLEGQIARTPMTCHEQGNTGELLIHPREGHYENMPDQRTYKIHLHLPKQPTTVKIENQPKAPWHYDEQTRTVLICAQEDLQRQQPLLIRWMR